MEVLVLALVRPVVLALPLVAIPAGNPPLLRPFASLEGRLRRIQGQAQVYHSESA